MKIKGTLIMVLLSLLFCCKGQKSENKRKSEELVDPIPTGTPFVLKRENMFLDLATELGIENIHGIVGLSVYIDSAGKIQGFRIMKLRLELNGEKRVNFINRSDGKYPYQKNEYPEGVQEYYELIEEYVNNLQFERDERVPLKTLNELTFIARIK